MGRKSRFLPMKRSPPRTQPVQTDREEATDVSLSASLTAFMQHVQLCAFYGEGAVKLPNKPVPILVSSH